MVVGPTNSRREFMKSVAFDGGTPTIVSSSTDNPYENDTSSRPEWLIDPKPVTYPPNRAQRRAMKKRRK